MGSTSQSWRVAESGLRRGSVDCRQVHSKASRATFPRLAHLPSQTRTRHRCHRSIRGSNHWLQFAVRSCHHQRARRHFVWVNVTAHPTAEWMARQVTEAFPWNEAPRYLTRDRNGVCGMAFLKQLRAVGICDHPTALNSPWQNPYAERPIDSIRRECLDHAVVMEEAHVRRILKAYAVYYNRSRTHRSLRKDCPIHRPVQPTGTIRSSSVLGGLHHVYART